MKHSILSSHLWWKSLLFTILPSLFLRLVPSSALTIDGVNLLSLRYSIIDDPLFVLQNWSYDDETPCLWTGVTCDGSHHVIYLALPNSHLLGSIPSDLGMLRNLQSLDLSNNFINGSLPDSVFNIKKLRVIDLSRNRISGELPESIGRLLGLQSLNLSENSFEGNLPESLSSLLNLTEVSLKDNYFSGKLPGGFPAVKFFDLSTNLINGSLPPSLGGEFLRYLNLSSNRISGEIPAGFAGKIPDNAALDFSFNNLSGQIPGSRVFHNQPSKSFAGNPNLCGSNPGKNGKNPCSNTTSPSNTSGASSPPAIAAIPRMTDPNPINNQANRTETGSDSNPGFKPGILIGIIIGNLAGIGILGIVVFYLCRSKKKKNVENTVNTETNAVKENNCSCLRANNDEEEDEDDEESEAVGSDYGDDQRVGLNQRRGESDGEKKGTLVTIDSGKELELETLLKASAYILGATGSSIMYKAVLQDGTVLAVRRISESSLDRFKDFEAQVRVLAKLAHPNLVRIKGFYWGTDEKLVIYDFVPNGSLANARYRKVGSSTLHLPWNARLKIARGVARGLTYLHEKKHVHGNLKPTNILLGFDMEPKIGDFGLEKLLSGNVTYRTGTQSARIFGSNRSTSSYNFGHSPSPSPSPSAFGPASPYHPPESLRSLKPNPKWDVFSFGIVLLELLTGKIVTVDESGQWNGLVVDDASRAVRVADVAIRGEVKGKEEILLACLKLGFSCASPVPHKRPNMKEVVQIFEKFQDFCSSSSFHYGY